jgi:hypothetical protein
MEELTVTEMEIRYVEDLVTHALQYELHETKVTWLPLSPAWHFRNSECWTDNVSKNLYKFTT